jgi:hypothetical protein
LTGSKAFLLLLALSGCRPNSPSKVLAPLAQGELYLDATGQANQPKYISFGDKLTASLFKHLERDPRYTIVPTSLMLVCPSASAGGTPGYLLTARILQNMGDSAIASLDLKCVANRQFLTYESDYLLVRRGRKWRLAKPLGSGVHVGV